MLARDARATFDRAALAAVAQRRRDAVDGEMDGAHGALPGVAVAVAAQERELDVVERIQVGETVADRAREGRVAGKELARAGDREQPVARRVPFGFYARKHRLAHARVGELGIARGDAEV